MAMAYAASLPIGQRLPLDVELFGIEWSIKMTDFTALNQIHFLATELRKRDIPPI